MNRLEGFLKASRKLVRRHLLWHFLDKLHKKVPLHWGVAPQDMFSLVKSSFWSTSLPQYGWSALLPSNCAHAQVAIDALHCDHDHHCEIRKRIFLRIDFGTWLRIDQSHRVNPLWPNVNSFDWLCEFGQLTCTVLISGDSWTIIYVPSCPKWEHEFKLRCHELGYLDMTWLFTALTCCVSGGRERKRVKHKHRYRTNDPKRCRKKIMKLWL